jgi:protoporphyrinogen oxidase
MKKALIIGAGPAGLTAALELLKKTDIKPVIFESDSIVGGISRTINYKGNRIDIGGHRFFSKSDRVMNYWKDFLPIQGSPSRDQKSVALQYQNKTRDVELNPNGPDPEQTDKVFLLRSRLSRIYYLRSFFDYPITLSKRTIQNLGLARIFKIGFSYLNVRLFPIRNEKTLEDFFINRFGKRLYGTFFKDYTEKVWGVPCHAIPAEWGAQRIKGISISKAVMHAIRSRLVKDRSVSQKKTETSLIERFLYPKFGPGQIWEIIADEIVAKGGEIHFHSEVIGVHTSEKSITEITVKNLQTGETSTHAGDYCFSTMPVKDLIRAMGTAVPATVGKIADQLAYRDFITVGLLLNQLKIQNETDIPTPQNIVPDNWIYIQESDVKVGRLQIFNNWSPYMIADPEKAWIGLEYFVNEGDAIWTLSDSDMAALGIQELQKIGIIDASEVLDSVVIRMKKTYPSYIGAYEHFDTVRSFTDSFPNLFLIGRNGMHRYNNQDHSMLTAMTAVENIASGITSKDNIWSVNTEKDYHEESSK